MGKLLALLALFLAAGSAAFGQTLEELLKELPKIKSPKELSKKIENLPKEERLKLKILLLTYSGREEEAEKLLKAVRESPVLSHVLNLPRGLYAVVVDKEEELLYVVSFKSNAPQVVKTFKCITGKRKGDKLKEGDMRTPEGVYFPLYWNSNLPPTYGIGAYPLNYPNLIDKKLLKRDGHGIWIHGTNEPNRPPHSTNGCIVLKNEDLKELQKYISLKRTPVVVVASVKGSSKGELKREAEGLLNFIEKWKRAWEETPKNIKPYLDCYSKEFVWKGGDYNSWRKKKERITRSKKWIKIKISDLTAAKDGRVLKLGNLYVVRFKLDYRSNNFNSKVNKLLYVIRERGRWKIVGEENL